MIELYLKALPCIQSHAERDGAAGQEGHSLKDGYILEHHGHLADGAPQLRGQRLPGCHYVGSRLKRIKQKFWNRDKWWITMKRRQT